MSNAFKELGGVEIRSGIFAALPDRLGNSREKMGSMGLVEGEPRFRISSKRGNGKKPEHEAEMVFWNDRAASELESGVFVCAAAFEFRALAEKMLRTRPGALAKRNGLLSHAEEKLRIGLSEGEVASRLTAGDFVKAAPGALGKGAFRLQDRFGRCGERPCGAERFGLQKDECQGVESGLELGKGRFLRHRGGFVEV